MKKAGIKVIRSAVGCLSAIALVNELKAAGVKVVGIDCDPLAVGLRLCDKSYVVPRGDDPAFLKAILDICDKEKPDAIISGPEEEILTLSKNKDSFKQRNVLVLCPDYATVVTCADKLKINQAFKNLGIPIPQIYDKTAPKFPCIIKPRFGRGGRGVYKVENPGELEFYRKKVTNPVIQEYIEGTEYTIDILADLDGNPLSIVPRARLQVESGISVRGQTVYDKEAIALAGKIVKELKLIGPSCIQCIKNDGGIKFTEINPRFGGGSILSIKADPGIIPNLIKIIKGDAPVPSKGFKQGLTMLRYYNEVFLTGNPGAPETVVRGEDESCAV
ncbi:MAG: ATP-grasp domain-containing protein [Dehalococcoidales bacterium]